MDYGKKVALIIGDSLEIGAEVALKFAKIDGFRVAFVGRRQCELDTIKEKISSTLGTNLTISNFLLLKANLMIQNEVDSIVEKTLKEFGRLDILVNNSGYLSETSYLDQAQFYADFEGSLEANLLALTRICQLASAHLIQSKGILVNVSVSSSDKEESKMIMRISSAGLAMLTKTLANSLAGSEVRVVHLDSSENSVQNRRASFNSNNQIDRNMKLKQVADSIVFLTSDKASFVHGSSININPTES